jgi:hypothetical protein
MCVAADHTAKITATAVMGDGLAFGVNGNYR